MEYTAVIRTLGTAGEKYQTLLDSLNNQTIQPKKILVYIAEGYSLPKETIGKEEYIYVKKGMVAQRALNYKEVESKYILFLDDDVFLPEESVEMLYKYLSDNNADVISPDVFYNAGRSFWGKLLMFISGRMKARKDDGLWGYKVMRNSGYSYNNNPKSGVYLSQTNAGPCFFCKKEVFLSIHFEDELWMDKEKYASGDDQVMFYKMYLLGLKQLTWFKSGIKHLDAGTTMKNEEKELKLISSDFRFKTIFWHRFIYKPDKCIVSVCYSFICIMYYLLFTLLVSALKLELDILKIKFYAIKDAINYIYSDEYKKIPVVNKKIQ